jgi:hypothetical protein
MHLGIGQFIAIIRAIDEFVVIKAVQHSLLEAAMQMFQSG